MSSENSRSEHSALSPLAFARAWQLYRTTAARTPFPDSRLLLAARFWRAHAQALHAPAFKTYAQEDLPPLIALIDKALPGDLLPDELEEVAAFLAEVASDQGEPAARARQVWEEAARGWFYVGEVERALRALAWAGLLPDSDCPKLMRMIAASDRSDAPEIPGLLSDHCTASHPELAQWLQRFSASWQARRETGDPRRAHCLLVEYDTQGRPVRGRVRTLQGTLTPLPSDTETDEVVFHHRVRTPDDPFVGTAYDALAALRSRGRGMRETGGPRYRAVLSLGGGNEEVYTGNSIGLAAFAVAFANRRADELHRDRRTIADTVAFTGGIDDHGEAQSVSDESLAAKIKRAFHSPLEYVVVPENNRREAEDCAAGLRKDHPRRRLHIIGVEDTADLIADHNILRTEKLCVGEFTIRAAARLSRNVKVQVPVLLLLLYALVCVIEPRAWVFFDWNPSSVELTTSGFRVLNKSGYEVWEKTYPCECDETVSVARVVDIDDDGRNEIAHLLKAREATTCEDNAHLFVYGYRGDLRFRRQCAILGEYPNDESAEQPYCPSDIAFPRIDDSTLIVTVLNISYPARSHIRIWSARGDSLGWYINSGFVSSYPGRYVSLGRQGLVFGGSNRRMRSACLFILYPDSSYGVSPPYEDERYNLHQVRRSNQRQYILFPPSLLCRSRHMQHNTVHQLVAETGHRLRVDTWESGTPAKISYYLDTAFHVYDVKFDDVFRTEYEAARHQGQLPRIDWIDYAARARDSVLFWLNDGWATLRDHPAGRIH